MVPHYQKKSASGQNRDLGHLRTFIFLETIHVRQKFCRRSKSMTGLKEDWSRLSVTPVGNLWTVVPKDAVICQTSIQNYFYSLLCISSKSNVFSLPRASSGVGRWGTSGRRDRGFVSDVTPLKYFHEFYFIR